MSHGAAGGNCAFVDAEHALDPTYARKLGVNLDDLKIMSSSKAMQMRFAFTPCIV